MKMGDGKFGYEKKTYFKLKDGDSEFRILPALGDLADDGVWHRYYQIHYGYRNGKGNMVTFQSPLVQDRKTKMIEVPDKALERIQKLKAELEKAKEAKNAPMVERLMKLVGGQKALYNLDKHHYMNAIDSQGNIGILKLRHKAKQALDLEIEKLRKTGVNPISVNNGRYFVFSRAGKGLDTTFQVTVKKEKLDVPGVGPVERDIVHKITPEIIARISKEAAVTSKEDGKDKGLDNLYPMFTAEQVERIVNESDILTGRSLALDAILAAKGTTTVVAPDESGDEESETETTTQTTTQASTPAPAVTTAPAPAQAPQTAVQTAVQTPVQTPVQTAPTAPTTMQTTAQAVADANISDADFLATLNLNQ